MVVGRDDRPTGVNVARARVVHAESEERRSEAGPGRQAGGGLRVRDPIAT
jgi:hypothetical protein